MLTGKRIFVAYCQGKSDRKCGHALVSLTSGDNGPELGPRGKDIRIAGTILRGVCPVCECPYEIDIKKYVKGVDSNRNMVLY